MIRWDIKFNPIRPSTFFAQPRCRSLAGARLPQGCKLHQPCNNLQSPRWEPSPGRCNGGMVVMGWCWCWKWWWWKLDQPCYHLQPPWWESSPGNFMVVLGVVQWWWWCWWLWWWWWWCFGDLVIWWFGDGLFNESLLQVDGAEILVTLDCSLSMIFFISHSKMVVLLPGARQFSVKLWNSTSSPNKPTIPLLSPSAPGFRKSTFDEIL